MIAIQITPTSGKPKKRRRLVDLISLGVGRFVMVKNKCKDLLIELETGEILFIRK